MELSEWHPADIKPVHIGVYERKTNLTTAYSKWNGVHWFMLNKTVDGAYFENLISSYQDDMSWRGLVEQQ